MVNKAKLHYTKPNLQRNIPRSRTQKIIWFNPSFSLNVKTNVAKMFLQVIDTRFPSVNKLHKTFNRNTVKVSYSDTQNISQIIKGYNMRVTRIKRQHQLECNCYMKTECSINGESLKRKTCYISA